LTKISGFKDERFCNLEKESRAIARKPRDAVRFGLMFADILLQV